jgi:hypothetical protein
MWVLCLGLSLLLIVGGVLVSELAFVAMGLVPIAFLYTIGYRLSAYLDQERIRYRGWLATSEVKWQEVIAVVPIGDLPYPRDRYYGPLCYEVRTMHGRFIVNLLYFPSEFARAFTDEVKRRRLIRR